jgi:uncharacterized protein (DUF58 family)
MRPTLRGVLLFATGVPVALGAVLISPRLWIVWLAYAGMCVVALGFDAAFGIPRRRVSVAIDAPDTLYIGEDQRGRVDIGVRGWQRGGSMDVLVDLDDDMYAPPLATASIAADGRCALDFDLRPKRRGTSSIDDVWLRWTGPFGLFERHMRTRFGRRIAVVPNVRAVRDAALRLFSQRELLSGLKVERYIGDGSEFESLREYVPGLDHRAINWKASARHRKLLCTEFRAERNHQVVLAVDTGHLMSEPLDGMPKLDHAINAGLLLCYLCLRTGDRVGLYGFDAEARTYCEPQGGIRAFHRLQRLSAELEYTTNETNFTLGLAELSTRLRRRSLVVVLTDFVDVISAELMIENLERLARRHVIVFVTLRDPSLEELTAAPPRRLDDVYRAVVAADFVRERELVLSRLRRLGVFCVDAPPARVSMNLLNRYLDIKRRELV